ncbi:hypothetical protein HYH03_015527 [Edaphochlamys debaryana]|uniref:Carotenoid oxygenase n=1 Tax=Edaphochlamys debaryana TaxID=47281 RepID=A0A836BR71_9CHLO|nr:hypothetical protein HYH03_015527 [Edaphochlamys debaryana]|eukprot:KAG2485817.1 hypothetical protein HYH03_015527 [Edaphochlamys debaryana]
MLRGGQVSARGHTGRPVGSSGVAPFRQHAASPRRVAVRVASPEAPATTSKTSTSDAVTSNANATPPDSVSTGQPVTAALIEDHRTLYSSLLHEYAYWVDPAWVEGTIPPELYGTYFRNGPALQVNNPRYKRHLFDGDGMVLSLGFREGGAFFRNRYVRTEGFVKEQDAGRPLYRNSFTRGSADGSPWFNPFDLAFKNVANTGVIRWADKLFALWEAGLPYALDPSSLETRGESRLGGALEGQTTFGGHYRVTPAEAEPEGRPRWVGFSTSTSFGGTALRFFEFGEGGELLHTTTHPLKGVSLAFVHDMLVTEHYYVAVMGPVEFDPATFLGRYIFSQASIAECLRYNPSKPTQVILIPRPGRPSGKVLQPRVLLTDPCFTFHHANAYELERPAPSPPSSSPSPPAPPSDEPLVVLDTVAWDSISFDTNQYTYDTKFYTGGPRTHLVRLLCDPASGSVARTRLLRRTLEFPCVDPRVASRPHRHVWAGCDVVDHPLHWGPLQGLARFDLPLASAEGAVQPPGAGGAAAKAAQAEAEARVVSSGAAEGVKADIWYAGPRRFPGEPMFVPRPGSAREGEGWLLAAVHNAESQCGEVVILDALDLARGPLATIRLPHRLPAGLHGSWDGAYWGPEPGDAAVPRWQELGSIKAL